MRGDFCQSRFVAISITTVGVYEFLGGFSSQNVFFDQIVHQLFVFFRQFPFLQISEKDILFFPVMRFVCICADKVYCCINEYWINPLIFLDLGQGPIDYPNHSLDQTVFYHKWCTCLHLQPPYLICPEHYIFCQGSGSFYCKPLYISFRLAEPTARREGRAEWIFFLKKRVLFEWFRDR